MHTGAFGWSATYENTDRAAFCAPTSCTATEHCNVFTDRGGAVCISETVRYIAVIVRANARNARSFDARRVFASKIVPSLHALRVLSHRIEK